MYILRASFKKKKKSIIVFKWNLVSQLFIPVGIKWLNHRVET